MSEGRLFTSPKINLGCTSPKINLRCTNRFNQPNIKFKTSTYVRLQSNDPDEFGNESFHEFSNAAVNILGYLKGQRRVTLKNWYRRFGTERISLEI